jgi:hypothetical protein
MASAQPPRDPRQAPPWPGPPFEPVTYTRGPVERPSEFPFKDPSQVHDLFPPVCLRTHWDPTRINRWTLPEIQVATPLDPRPYTKVCLNMPRDLPTVLYIPWEELSILLRATVNL